jgi:hypothetical protein
MWSHNRQIYQMPCHPPDIGDATSCLGFAYFPIFRLPDRASMAGYPLSLSIVPWQLYADNENTNKIRWYPNYTPADVGTVYYLSQAAPGFADPAVTYGDKISVPGSVRTYTSTDFSVPSNGGDYSTAMLVTDNILPAALSISLIGPQGSPLDADWSVKPSDVSHGMPLYGSDTSRAGLGRLIGMTTHGLDTASSDCVASAIAAPVFTWGHHHGLWVGQGESSLDIFGSTIRVRPREVYAETTVQLSVALVYSAGSECNIQVLSTVGGTGDVQITLPAAVNPTLIASASGGASPLIVSTDPDLDVQLSVLVSTPDVSSANDWCIIHSISVYPHITLPPS